MAAKKVPSVPSAGAGAPRERGNHVTGLECADCGQRQAAAALATVCPCGGPLLVRYDLAAIRERHGDDGLPVEPQARGVWRYAPLLPLHDAANRVTLGEGGTPLLPLPRVGKAAGLAHLLAKWEGANPTGTFKDRGMTLAVSMAKELGVRRLVVPTAGNAGAAAAAYAARAGIPLAVIAPETTPEANLMEARTYGATVRTCPGTIADAGRLAAEEEKAGAFNLATFREPYRLEGKKTMTYEIVEALGGPPDAVVYPTGGGTGLVGVHKAVSELQAMGLVGEGGMPRLYAVQAEGCAPIVEAFHAGWTEPRPPSAPHTIASGLNVPAPRSGRLMLQLIRKTGGAAVAVSDPAIVASARRIALEEGLLVAPEAAAAYAALGALVADGSLHAKERIVCFFTGSGLKYPKVFQR